MRAMQLDKIEARVNRSPRTCYERGDNARNAGFVKRNRSRPTLGMRKRRRPDRRPAARRHGTRERSGAIPRASRTGFAPRVPDLHAEWNTLPVIQLGQLPEARDLAVLP